MMMTDAAALMISPYPPSIGISIHPRDTFDAVAVSFTDALSGQQIRVVLDPETTKSIGDDLVRAVTDPAIGAQADQIRARKRDETQF